MSKEHAKERWETMTHPKKYGISFAAKRFRWLLRRYPWVADTMAEREGLWGGKHE